MTGPVTALDAALAYAARGWPIFPCSARKVPIPDDWANVASTDPADIIDCWGSKLPHALIGMPTGERTKIVVLDIDMKHGKNGLRTLAELLGCPILPAAPTVLTAHGGYHLHFQRPEGGFRNTVGAEGRGIGPGLDWRADGGLIILPSPGSGYSWGTFTYDNCPLRLPPVELLPRDKPAELNPFHRLRAGPTTNGLAGVLRRLHGTPQGTRNSLLFWASCRFAEAVAIKLISEDDARRLLHSTARHTGLPDWRITKAINSGFKTINRTFNRTGG